MGECVVRVMQRLGKQEAAESFLSGYDCGKFTPWPLYAQKKVQYNNNLKKVSRGKNLVPGYNTLDYRKGGYYKAAKAASSYKDNRPPDKKSSQLTMST